MSERSDQGAIIVVAGILMLVILLLSAGGVGLYIFSARQSAVAVAEARMAHQAATAARMQLEKAQ